MRKLKRIPFTKEGFEKLKQDYENLLAKRPTAVLTLKQARELGDLSENGLYKAARANLSSIDAQIRRLDMTLKLAMVTESSSNERIEIGSQVIITDGKIKREFHIVGDYEADPKENKISTKSPIGNALVGKKVGDSITVNTPNGKVMYKVIKIDSNL